MPTIDEALAASEAEGTYEIFLIDKDLRTINIPDGVTNIGVESDDSVRVVHFKMPRYYCGFDLSTFSVRVNYENANKKKNYSDISTVDVQDDALMFDWTVERDALAYKGTMKFSVCLRKYDSNGIIEQEFNTTICKETVLEGLEATELIPAEQYTDSLDQVVQKADEAAASASAAATSASEAAASASSAQTSASEAQSVKAAADAGDFQGATFIPSVSTDGIISWTNDKGRMNPEPRNIKGEAATIEVGTVSIGSEAAVVNSGTSSAAIFNFTIPSADLSIEEATAEEVVTWWDGSGAEGSGATEYVEMTDSDIDQMFS